MPKELAIEVSKDGKFVVCDPAVIGEVLDDIVIRTSNGNTASLKQLLKDLGEI